VKPAPVVSVSPNPESTYIPTASSLEPAVAAAAPDATVPALLVVPVAWAT
jgi:hypothetical protein